MKKWLVVGIIFLFISVSIAPSINFSVVKAYNENDLVEITTEACGIKGYGNQTVKLTREQYQNLEQYLVDFRARLNTTTNKEEAVPIFKEAVVELNKYGLLPKGMSVEQAQKLVIGQYPKMVDNILNEKSLSSDIYDNLLCLIAGRADGMGFIPIAGIIYIPIYGIGLTLALIFYILNYEFHLFPIAYKFFAAVYSNLYKIYVRLGDYYEHARIMFGSDVFYWRGYSNGWIHTFGFLGNKNISGDFEGVLPYYIPGFKYFLILQGDTGRGVSGFNGIRVYLDIVTVFYIGNAFQVRIKVS